MKSIRTAGVNISMILLGIALNAFAVEAFCLPYGILVGGATGIGRLLNYFTDMPVSMGVMCVNAALLVLAFFCMGKRCSASIVLGTFLYPALMAFFEGIPQIRHMVQDPLLAALCGGGLMGVGIGLVIRNGGSLGGSDVVPVILHKKAKLPIAPVMYGLDVAILVLQGFLASPNEIILGILMTLTYTVVANKTLLAGGGHVQFMIFSPQNEKIKKLLVERGFGATLLHGKTAYFSHETDVLITILSVRYMNYVKDRILEIDDKAFMTISSVREVDGRGFTISMDS